MTERDEQVDNELKQMLGDAGIPPAREDARRRAIALARAEFVGAREEGFAEKDKRRKGLIGWLRLIVGSNTDDRSSIMTFNQKFVYGGMTAIAVGVIAVGITLQNQPGAGYRGGIGSAYTDPREVGVDAEVGGSAAARPFGELNRVEDEEVRLEARQEPARLAAEPQAAEVHALEEVVKTARRADDRAYAATPGVPATLDMSAAKMAPVQLADSDLVPQPGYREIGRDDFEAFEQNRVKLVAEEPVSTFSVDVDTASYSFVRRMLNSGVLPQGDAVRAEELINYFDYDYPLPAAQAEPFHASVAVSDAPWAEGRKLLHIGIKGFDIEPAKAPRSNLVFLLDVSGSMNSPDKLPLVKQSMELLLTTLRPEDTVAIAVYAGAAGVVLEPTPVRDKQKILEAMHQLRAGGSTAGAQGVRLAYELAESRFDKDAVNRVILATDGDFNVGITDRRELKSFIERKREEGIFLSVLGFGQGNYQDALMQTLAQNGNGVAAYIDTLSEAQKVLVDEATSTLFPIARDVKIQVEFNPAAVAEYRLIGYETRHLNREDFNNDAVDAGDIGAGHTVTAIYEFTPVGSPARQVGDSRYQRGAPPVGGETGGRDGEYAFLKIRYKLPEEDASRLITRPITREDAVRLGGDGIGREAGFATAVAGFAQLLKGGRYTGEYGYDDVVELALESRGSDPYGYRSEFVQLVRKAKSAEAMQRR